MRDFMVHCNCLPGAIGYRLLHIITSFPSITGVTQDSEISNFRQHNIYKRASHDEATVYNSHLYLFNPKCICHAGKLLVRHVD